MRRSKMFQDLYAKVVTTNAINSQYSINIYQPINTQTSQKMFLNLYVNHVTIFAVRNIYLLVTYLLESIRRDARRRKKYPPESVTNVKRFTAVIGLIGPILRNVPEMFQMFQT